MRYLLLIESNTTGTGRLFAQTAMRLGLRPLLLAAEPGRYGYAANDGIEVMRVDTADYRALETAVSRFAAGHPVAGVCSSSEYWIEASARLALRLALPGADPESIALCRNKRRQRDCFTSRRLPSPWFVSITHEDELERRFHEMPLPWVVKPVEGSGSAGVKLCRDRREVVEHARLLLQQKTNERGLPIPLEALIEEYLRGTEYSVEIFGGEVVGVTRKYLSREPFFVEVGHDFPAQGPEEVLRTIGRSAMQALSAVGLSWGPAHIEIRVTERGPIVIEINPRLAGGFIPELVRESTGIDLIKCTILAAIGGAPGLVRRRSKHSSIRFLMPEKHGVLCAVRGVEEAALVESVSDVTLYKKPGDHVLCRGDFRDRLGHVITCHKSAESAMFYAERARDMLVPEIAEETVPQIERAVTMQTP
jgi:argininosuccinate lyase